MDWNAWMERWDHQQEGYLGNREERFDVLVDVVAHRTGEQPTVLDLCCGPGSLAARVLDRIPGARVVALDADPVLQLLGRKVYGTSEGRLTWVNHELADPAWEQAAAVHGPFDAVVSTTALHWLRAAMLASVYEATWRLLRGGGVFADGDHLLEDDTQPGLQSLGRALRVTPDDEREAYASWWDALATQAVDDADLAAAFDDRTATGTGHPEAEGKPALSFHIAALRHAGFTEVGTIWQQGDDRVLVALRD